MTYVDDLEKRVEELLEKSSKYENKYEELICFICKFLSTSVMDWNQPANIEEDVRVLVLRYYISNNLLNDKMINSHPELKNVMVALAEMCDKEKAKKPQF